MQVVVDYFLDTLNSKHTKEQYKRHFERFKEYLPTAEKDNQDVKLLTDSITSYLKQMENDGLSHSYRSLALAAIKHYYSMKDIILNWTKIYRLLGEKRFDNEIRAYTTEEIQRMLNVADVKYNAIILLYASTGMRREALTQIKIGDMEYLDKYQLYKIKVYKKTEDEYVCFTTPEAAKAINLYLKIKPLNKGDYFHDVGPKSVSMHLRKLSIEAGIGKKHVLEENEINGQFRDSTPAVHAIRKWTISQMKRAKVDTEDAKLLTAHSIGIRAKYVERTDQELLESYLPAIPFLTISIEESQRKKIQILEQNESEIDSLRKQVSILKKERDESELEILKMSQAIKEMDITVTDLEAIKKEIGELRSKIEGDISNEPDRKKVDELLKGTAKNIMKSSKKK